ncbi:Ovule protein [Caenorhabditis elegans]|uniref:Ovule protein n=1 Tax=Caenorhabditis elegans TaxID=6239 RepID=Q21634_CAEEL|nr:Ovule protein [Caenorhabditis elegans]CAB01431.1 Ovule protein [Caenorhabditis elegans]|eukprot:NP_506594.1 Uncharacterized protein CELE_R02D5.4 [Caenorhabditis elegans]
MSLHHHQHQHRHQPPTYEDSIKSYSPPKYDMTPATTNSTTHNSMELPTSSATTARIEGARMESSRQTPILLLNRSMSDSCLKLQIEDEEEEGRKSAR